MVTKTAEFVEAEVGGRRSEVGELTAGLLTTGLLTAGALASAAAVDWGARGRTAKYAKNAENRTAGLRTTRPRTTDHRPRTKDRGPRTKDQGPRTTDWGKRQFKPRNTPNTRKINRLRKGHGSPVGRTSGLHQISVASCDSCVSWFQVLFPLSAFDSGLPLFGVVRSRKPPFDVGCWMLDVGCFPAVSGQRSVVPWSVVSWSVVLWSRSQ